MSAEDAAVPVCTPEQQRGHVTVVNARCSNEVYIFSHLWLGMTRCGRSQLDATSSAEKKSTDSRGGLFANLSIFSSV